MMIAELCETYGWDYNTYMAQPSWFIQLLTEKYIIIAKKNKQSKLNSK